MSVAQLFLQRVENLGLLDEKVLAHLRKQVAEAKGPVTAETLAKVLVDNGHLTVFQAKKLVGEVTSAVEKAKAEAAAQAAPKAKPHDEFSLADDDGLEILDDPKPAQPVAIKKPVTPPPPAGDGLELLEDEGLELLDDAPPAPSAKPAAVAPQPVAVDGLELLGDDDRLELLDDAPVKKAIPTPPASPKPTATAPTAPKPTAKSNAAPQLAAKKGAATVPNTPAAPVKKEAVKSEPVKQPGPAKQTATQVEGLTLLGDGDLEVLDDGLTALDDPLGDPLSGASLLAPATKPNAPAAKKPKQSGNPWDSALIYVGGAALILLVLVGVGLYFTLARGSANEAFQVAEDDFKAQSFATANEKYAAFLARFRNDPNASLARVRMGIGEMRLAVDEGRDMGAALQVIQDNLQRIESEERFDEARADLAEMLPKVADRLAQEARRSSSDIPKAAALTAQAETALGLINNGAYIPGNLRQLIEGKVTSILRDVATVKREINRDKELKATIVGIGEALAAGDTTKATALRYAFLKSYPGLDRNEEVLQATLAITQKEQSLVKVASEPLSPAPLEPSPLHEMVLASPDGETVAGSTMVVTMTLQGSIYGFDSASGAVLWRQFIGIESTGQPVAISPAPGADVVVLDERKHDLLCLRIKDGVVQWRLPVGEVCYLPTVVGDKLLVTTASGKLLEVESQTGQSQRRAVLPQGAAQSAAFDPRRPHVYQLGEQSSLFVLAADTLECREVLFLGHQPGGIAVPPVVTGGQVFIANNVGADYSLVHIYSTDAEGRNLEKKRDVVRLAGHVVTAPIVDGRRVYVFTDLGAAHVFDVDPANVKEPVADVTKLVATRKSPLVSFAVVADGNAWVGDERMTMYELLPAKKELARRWSRFQGEVTLAPPRRVGEQLISARLRHSVGDIALASVNAADGAAQWTTSIAVPFRAINEVAGKPVAVNANAALVSLVETKPGIVEPMAKVDVVGAPLLFGEAISTDARMVVGPRIGEAQWAWIDREASAPKVSLVKFAGAALTAPAAPCEDGLLLPLDNGQVALVDIATGKPLLLPFQPRLEVGSKPAWQRPLVLSNIAGRFVITNDTGKVFLVERKEQPQPHLSLVKEYESGGNVGAIIAQVEDQLIISIEKDGQHLLQPLSVSDLTPAEPFVLTSAVAFGPRTIGAAVLLATDADGLMSLDKDGKTQWRLPLDGAGVSGVLQHELDLLVVTTRGNLLRISPEGKVIKQFASQRPLTGDPVSQGDVLWFPGADGAVYSLPIAELSE